MATCSSGRCSSIFVRERRKKKENVQCTALFVPPLPFHATVIHVVIIKSSLENTFTGLNRSICSSDDKYVWRATWPRTRPNLERERESFQVFPPGGALVCRRRLCTHLRSDTSSVTTRRADNLRLCEPSPLAAAIHHV